MDAVKVGRQQEFATPTSCGRKRKAVESGQSLIEFALMLPVLVLLSVGIVEIGRAAAITIAVHNAAKAGVEYGSQDGATAIDKTGMIQSATDDANLPGVGNLMMTATATYGCTCDMGDGTSCPNPVPPEGTCPIIDCGGGQIVECVQVKTMGTWDALFPYAGLPRNYYANGDAVMRVRR